MREQVYFLTEYAPSRADGITLGMTYAQRAGDQVLFAKIQKNLNTLGLLYVPGSAG